MRRETGNGKREKTGGWSPVVRAGDKKETGGTSFLDARSVSRTTRRLPSRKKTRNRALQGHGRFSRSGAVWTRFSDPEISGLHSRESGRRRGETIEKRIRSFPSQREGISDRTSAAARHRLSDWKSGPGTISRMRSRTRPNHSDGQRADSPKRSQGSGRGVPERTQALVIVISFSPFSVFRFPFFGP